MLKKISILLLIALYSSTHGMLMRLSSLKPIAVQNSFRSVATLGLGLMRADMVPYNRNDHFPLVSQVMHEGEGLLYDKGKPIADQLKQFEDDTLSEKKIIRLQGNPAGFVKYTYDNDQSSLVCSINLIGIAQEFQGKKLGSQIVDHVLDEARELAGKEKDLVVLLLVYKDNEKAQKLYLKKGFAYGNTFGSCRLMTYSVKSELLAQKRKRLLSRLIGSVGFGIASYQLASVWMSENKEKSEQSIAIPAINN